MKQEASELLPEIPNLFDYLSVHAQMVYDETRSLAYKQAIEKVIKPGIVVVDIGTGTGFLALLCAKAGAERIHAIESSPIINYARALARANNLDDRIVFHQGYSSAVEIGEDVDVILSELIGHMAFEEGMVETIIEAKRRYLKKDGIVVPEAVALYGAPVFKPGIYRRYIDCWKKPVCGLDFSYGRGRSLQTPWITNVSARDLIALPQVITSVDFMRSIIPNAKNMNRFIARKDSPINGIAFWFDARLVDGVHLSTRPGIKTHWQQCFVPLDLPFKTSRGDVIDVVIDMKFPNTDNTAFSVDVSATKAPN